MRRHLLGSASAALLLLALTATSAAASPVIDAWTDAPSGGQVTLHFSHFESSAPYSAPEWTGYDAYRRSLDECDTWVRLNDEPYARQSGNYEYTYTDAPAAGHAYEYRVWLVDVNREQVSVAPCDCHLRAFATLDFTTPISQGRLIDWGWAAGIEPCLGSCLPYAYISPVPTELVPYVGTNTTLRFYGTMACGSVEGCSLQLEHFNVSACDVVIPARRTSWGQVKTIYR